MSYLTLKQFGLPLNALAVHLETADLDNVSTHVEGCVLNKNIANIVGYRGAGKTTSVRKAVEALNAAKPKKPIKIVKPISLDKERMRIGSILEAFFHDLSDESPKRSAEARMAQLRRILGTKAAEFDIVLVIEESHRFHASTLRSLKGLMELEWMGRGPLLSIVLIGQHDPLTVPSLAEIAKPPRSNLLVMGGLSEAEARGYIAATVGRVWTQDAIGALVATQAARNYLDLQEAVVVAMDQALSEGRKTVELSDVYHAAGGGLKEMAEQLGVSQGEIGKAIGKDKSTVNRIMSGERNDPEAKQRIKALLDHKRGVGGAGEAASEPEAMRKAG
jgi:type II secretory pathway predicted ATPase ExeA